MSGVYAHDAHCNTIHVAGPEECPPARDVPHTLAQVLAAAREEGRRQGWAEAIAALRDREVWRADDPHDEFGTGQFVVLTAAADYLADQAPREETT